MIQQPIFLHKYELQKSSCAENIVSFQSAEEII